MSPLRILIIEDEKPAVEKLTSILLKYNSKFSIVKNTISINESVEFLKSNLNSIDLIFLDIQLTDGLSFSIFEKIKITKPVIFTTAYNEYALKAFQLNSIDYILKPYIFEDIKKALDKFFNFKNVIQEKDESEQFDIEFIKKVIAQEKSPIYKERFMVRKGEKIKAIDTSDIKLFYADDRDVYLISSENRTFAVNHKLEEVEKMLDPKKFFRVNRTYIVQFVAINEIIAYSNSRLKIDTNCRLDKEIIVSREKVGAFKRWIEGE